MKKSEAKPRLSLQELRAKATEILKQQHHFLLLYDVIGSKRFVKEYGSAGLYHHLHGFHSEINKRFKKLIVPWNIAIGRTLPRFDTILGDGGGAYFSDPSVIEQILELAKRLPFKLRWAIAKDGWDESGTKILK